MADNAANKTFERGHNIPQPVEQLGLCCVLTNFMNDLYNLLQLLYILCI